MRGKLHRIVQRRKLGDAAPSERRSNQVVREVRVLGQQRAVKIRAQYAAQQVAFRPVAAIVAEAEPDPAERSTIWTDEGTPAVVFESDQRAWRDVLDLDVDDDVADEALLAGLSSYVDQTDAGESLTLGSLVVVT
jgi:hypothetical protein